MKKRVIAVLTPLLVLLSIGMVMGAEMAVPQVKSFAEVEKMQNEFGKIVGKKPVEEWYLSSTAKYCAMAICANPEFQKSQYFIFADRNPANYAGKYVLAGDSRIY